MNRNPPPAVALPPATPFRGKPKLVDVLANLAVATLAAALAALIFAVVPADVVAMRAVAWASVFTTLSTLALAVGFALTRQLPTLRRADLGAEDAVVVRAWPGDWWHTQSLDLAQLVLTAVLATLGLMSGGTVALLSLLVAGAGGWLAVRLGLGLTGHRRNETLWVTDDRIVHDSSWGREWCPTSQVRQVRRVTQTELVRLVLAGPATVSTGCPRLWRRRRRAGFGRDHIVVDCSMMGHEPDDLVAWLKARHSLAENGGRTVPTRRRRSRWGLRRH